MASRVDEIRGIQGFLTPVYSDDELPGRESRHALTPSDMVKVRDGLACPRCLAFWDSYRPVCPVCKHERNISEDIVRAHDWEAAEQARQAATADVRRTPRIPAHRMVERIMREQS